MADDPKMKLGPIPEVARILIEPFRHVMSPGGRPIRNDDDDIQTTIVPPHFDIPDEAYLAIGRVAYASAMLEHALQFLLSRLALAAPFPALALTADLGIDNRFKALKLLIQLHRERYFCEIVPSDILDAMSKLIPIAIRQKDERNRFVHTVWTRGVPEHELTAVAKRPMTESAALGGATGKATVAEMLTLATEMRQTANGFYALAQIVPEVDEASHAQSLALRKRRPRSETPQEP